MALNAEAHWPPASNNQELLQHGAFVQQELEVPFLHDEGTEAKLPEVGESGYASEGGGFREPPEADIEFGEGGAPEDHRGEEHVGVECSYAVDKEEFLDALGD